MEPSQKEINPKWRGQSAKIWSDDRRTGIKFSTILSRASESIYVSVLILLTLTLRAIYICGLN